jgi:hypothetical protein
MAGMPAALAGGRFAARRAVPAASSPGGGSRGRTGDLILINKSISLFVIYWLDVIEGYFHFHGDRSPPAFARLSAASVREFPRAGTAPRARQTQELIVQFG